MAFRHSINRHEVLERLAIKRDWRAGAEIGVNDGETFFYLLDNVWDLRMVAVDSWATDVPGYGDLTQVGETFRKAAEAYGDRAHVLWGDSVAMADLQPRTLDFVFIDADHSEQAVVNDITAWRMKLRPGGMILGHDINVATVRAAVDRMFPVWRNLPGDVWAVEV